ncbi:unnamed protein product [Darwinula stevensoni]|uniref:Ammonium transporter AmtB-like domain-containing protein n=1 Tax=Darwinula stevensoni TaxID=69355 RepID=A0A7R9ABA9_9CRUS|nr:unnamed protein product [Darwinula stevensoni]CAG0899112.1 unnamed protein product [Darwinula stevensoni]
MWFIYPVASHWVWHPEGWLRRTAFKDYAGGGVVHMLGGSCALVGAVLLGPRIGRFHGKTGEPHDIRGHSVPVCAFLFLFGGTGRIHPVVRFPGIQRRFPGSHQPSGRQRSHQPGHSECPPRCMWRRDRVLLFGFLAFNAGFRGHISHLGDSEVISRAIVNALLGACGGGIGTLVIHRVGTFGPTHAWSFLMTLNGALAGLAHHWVFYPYIVGPRTLKSSSIANSQKQAEDDSVETLQPERPEASWTAPTTLQYFKNIYFQEQEDRTTPAIPARRRSHTNKGRTFLEQHVGVCAGSDVYPSWAALVVGVGAGFTFLCLHFLLLRLQIDDPLDAFPVHFGGGFFGMIAVAIFMRDGIVFNPTKNAAMVLAWNLAGAAAIFSWSSSLCLVLFGILKKLGFLRVSKNMEIRGSMDRLDRPPRLQGLPSGRPIPRCMSSNLLYSPSLTTLSSLCSSDLHPKTAEDLHSCGAGIILPNISEDSGLQKREDGVAVTSV